MTWLRRKCGGGGDSGGGGEGAGTVSGGSVGGGGVRRERHVWCCMGGREGGRSMGEGRARRGPTNWLLVPLSSTSRQRGKLIIHTG